MGVRCYGKIGIGFECNPISGVLLGFFCKVDSEVDRALTRTNKLSLDDR
jgi:hypothetical protein